MTNLPHDDAETIFATWAEQAEAGEARDFSAVIAEHPNHANALQLMHADWLLFAPILMRVVPGLMASQTGLPDALPAASIDDSIQPVSSELIERLGIQLPDAGRYRFRGVLGRGGGGVVLRVWDQKLHRALAMKVVLGRGEAEPTGDTPQVDAAMMTRFVDEARISSQLDHPGIVPVHELGTDATGRAFFTMRLVKGEDLSKIFARLRAGSDEWTQVRALGVMAKVCEAVAFAHEKGVVHRDLKPANVMVGRHGEVHVMDWGLARVLGSAIPRTNTTAQGMASQVDTLRRRERSDTPNSPLLTRQGSILGTPAYMSPEQARGDLERVDARSDVYVIGAMLYELIAGVVPFVPAGAQIGPEIILMRVLEGPPQALAKLAPKAPPELVAICEKAMERKPEQRYADVRALERDLRAYLERKVVKAYETGTWAETKKWARRNMGLASSLGGIVLLATAGAVVLASQVRVTESARADAERSAIAARSMHYVASMLGAASAHRAGERANVFRLLDDAPVELRHWEWHALKAVSDTRICTMRGHTGFLRGVSFSPDGNRVLTASADGTARVWNASTGEQILRLDHESQVFEAVFTPDGRRIVTHTLYDVFRTWDAETAELLVVIGEPTDDEMWPSACMSDDTRKVALCRPGDMVTVWSNETGKISMNLAGEVGIGGFNCDASRLLTISSEDRVTLWNTDTGEALACILESVSTKEGWIVQFSASGDCIVSWSPRDPSVQIRDSETGLLIAELPISETVTKCSFSNLASRIAVMTTQGARVFDIDTKAEIFHWENDSGCDQAVFRPDDSAVLISDVDSAFLLELPSGECNYYLVDFDARNGGQGAGHLLFSPDGTRVLHDGSGSLWDATTGSLLPRLDPDGDFGHGSFKFDGTQIVGSMWENTAGVWDGRNGVDLRNCEVAEEIQCLAFTADGSRAVTIVADRGLQVWEMATCRELMRHALGDASSTKPAASFSPDGLSVLVPTIDNTLILNASTGDELMKLKGCADPSIAMFDRGGTAILTLRNKGLIEMWDASTGQCRASWSRPETNFALWGPDGCVVTTEDADLFLWNSSNGEMDRRLKGHSERITSISLAPDGATIVSKSWGQTIAWQADGSHQEITTNGSVAVGLRFNHEGQFSLAMSGDSSYSSGTTRLEVRDASTLSLLVSLQVYSGSFVAAAMTSDGRRIATTSSDDSLSIWDAATAQELLRLETSIVDSVAFSPDDRWVCVGGRGLVRMYDSVARQETQAKREALLGLK